MKTRSLAVGLLSLCVLPLIAFAQNIPERRVGIQWRDSVPAISVSARDLVTPSVVRKLESGLPQTIVMQTFAYEQGGELIAAAPTTCRVVYDLWEAVYRVQVTTASTNGAQSAATLDGVLSRCLVLRRMAIGSREQWQPRRGHSVYFAALVELNPLSDETVQRIRRWLARPSGRVENDSFFGSFVNVFVNRRVGAAERTVRFHSQSERVP